MKHFLIDMLFTTQPNLVTESGIYSSSVEVDSSSFFLKLSMMLLTMSICFYWIFIEFFIEVLVFNFLIRFAYILFYVHSKSSSSFVSFSYNNILSFCKTIHFNFITFRKVISWKFFLFL